MKKLTLIVCTAVSLLLTGCTGTTGNIFSGIDGANTIGNILTSVLGINQVTQESLIGTWKYYQPGCGFASDNLLAKAGGEVAAAKIKSELASTYQTMGIKSSNTYFTFNQDNSFSGKMMGTPLSGSYVYDPNTGQITLKTVLLSVNGFINTSGSGISLLFESKKLLNILQLVGSASGNATLATVSELSKNYDGVRLGFDLAR